MSKKIAVLLVLLSLTVALLPLPAAGQEMMYNEAPELAEKVAAGELPPVDERLPSDPMVVEPLEMIGEYGGTWHMALSGGADQFMLWRTIGYEPLLRWTPAWDGWLPNVAKEFEINEDSTVFTVTLHEGMKWSDGDSFDADDIMFWYEDVLLNEELTPSLNSTFTVADEPVVVEKIDDVTVTFTFADSYGFFPLRLAYSIGLPPISFPRHYLEQFHPDYNKDAAKLAEEAGYSSWVDYFFVMAETEGGVEPNIGLNPEKPVITAWSLNQSYPGGESVIVAERNPYYWKVDPEGNQLPYIDNVEYFVAEDPEAIVLRALAGEIDMQSRHIDNIQNKPIFFDNQDEGDYRLFNTVSTWGNAFCIFPNHSIQDEQLRELFHNKDFRIGLSHAIDRQEIIDLVYLGQGIPSQFAPHLDGPFANEQMSTQYLEYNVDLANEHLDKVLPDKDDEGFRLLPDGERLLLTAELASAFLPQLVDGMELVKVYWADVGIDLNVKVEDRSIQWERKAANELELFLWAAGGGGGLDVLLNVQSYFPDRAAAFQAPAWGDWYASQGAEGEEPPENVKRMMELYRELQKIADPEEQREVMSEIIQISADWFPEICVTTQPDLFGVVKNNMHNVPESMLKSATYPNPGPTNPETYFFSD